MARIVRASAAKADAREIWAYIAEENPDAADRLLDRFDKLFRLLAAQPHLGESAEGLAAHLRVIPLGNYLVFIDQRKTALKSSGFFTERGTSRQNFSARRR